MKLDYDLSALRPYINWTYFYFAWQLKEPGQQQLMRREAEEFLDQLGNRYQAHGLLLLPDAHSEDDDIVVSTPKGSLHLPMLRQQTGRPPHRCLADYVHPRQDKIGIFATSVDRGMETDFRNDPYQQLMAQLLADRLAEAAAERLHQEVRTRYWGYAPDEQLPMEELHLEHFQGIRPAVGYPSLPDTSLNFLLDQLLEFRQIGIRLTESGAMSPHASVSGLMLAHPEARYFAVGKIGEDQLADYARRRNMPLAMARRFLGGNLQ